jgi:hypothetical protein
MIINLKIKASPVKGMPMDHLFKKLEAGKTITGVDTTDRHLLKLEMETDIETIKKIVEFVQELGKGERPSELYFCYLLLDRFR